MDSRVRCWVFLTISAALLAGCTPGGPTTAPVSGTVTLDGEPVEGARVTFMTEGAPRAATGVTDAQGRYQLTTFEKNDGAIPGTHKVTVAMGGGGTEGISVEDPSAGYGEAMMGAAAGKPAEAKAGAVIPPKYTNPATSGLTAEVKPGQSNTCDLPLTSGGSATE